MQEKVVGTSFVRQIPFEELNGTKTPKEETERGIEQFHTEAYLQPEPTNPYDSKAVAVMVVDKNGQAHRVGYLGKRSELKKRVKGNERYSMTIHKYSDIGLLNSYILEEELENTFVF